MKSIFLAVVLLVVVSCSSKIYVPTEKNVDKFVPASLAELKQGHELYLNNCGKCHKLYSPGSHSDSEWKKILEKMAPKAKLDNDQSYLVFRYLVNR